MVYTLCRCLEGRNNGRRRLICHSTLQSTHSLWEKECGINCSSRQICRFFCQTKILFPDAGKMRTNRTGKASSSKSPKHFSLLNGHDCTQLPGVKKLAPENTIFYYLLQPASRMYLGNQQNSVQSQCKNSKQPQKCSSYSPHSWNQLKQQHCASQKAQSLPWPVSQ